MLFRVVNLSLETHAKEMVELYMRHKKYTVD